MAEKLNGKKIAILATDGFEPSELLLPRAALDEAGATTEVVSPKKRGERIQGWSKDQPGEAVPVDVPLAEARADRYDALLLPGGVKNPDRLRTEPEASRASPRRRSVTVPGCWSRPTSCAAAS
jgi:protease I